MISTKFSAKSNLASLALALLPMALLLAMAPPAKANLVFNGSFTQYTTSSGDYFCASGAAGSNCTSSNVLYWQSSCSTAGACGTTGTVVSLIPSGTGGSGFNDGLALGVSVPNSPDGGNFVAADGDAKYGAPIWQVITGLRPGEQYSLSFYQAAAEQKGSSTATTEQWQVSFAGTTIDSTLMNNPNQSTYQAWTLQHMVFTVPTTSTGTETLEFLALGTPAGYPPVVLLDGVDLEAPEPQTCAAVAAGLAGIALLRRRARVRRQHTPS